MWHIVKLRHCHLGYGISSSPKLSRTGRNYTNNFYKIMSFQSLTRMILLTPRYRATMVVVSSLLPANSSLSRHWCPWPRHWQNLWPTLRDQSDQSDRNGAHSHRYVEAGHSESRLTGGGCHAALAWHLWLQRLQLKNAQIPTDSLDTPKAKKSNIIYL